MFIVEDLRVAGRTATASATATAETNYALMQTFVPWNVAVHRTRPTELVPCRRALYRMPPRREEYRWRGSRQFPVFHWVQMPTNGLKSESSILLCCSILVLFRYVLMGKPIQSNKRCTKLLV